MPRARLSEAQRQRQTLQKLATEGKRLKDTSVDLVDIDLLVQGYAPVLDKYALGQINLGLRQVAADTAVAPGDNVIMVDASGGAVAITLPAAAADTGRSVVIKKIDASANAVTISPAGADTIGGAASHGLPTQNDMVQLVSDGVSDWVVV